MTSESVVARHHAASSRATPARVLHAEERLRITCTVPPAPPAIRLLGEIDASNTAALARTLAHPPAAPRAGGEPLPVHLADVTFIDVAGLRTLLLMRREGRIELHDPPPQVRRLLTLIGP